MKLTLEAAKKMFEMREQGIKVKQIAEELGVSEQTVRNRLMGERPPVKDTVHEPLEPTNQMTASEYREHVLKQKEAEKPEDKPTLTMRVTRAMFIGKIGRYIVDSGGVTVHADELDYNLLPEMAKELQALSDILADGRVAQDVEY